MQTIVSIDPGVRNLGWAVIKVFPEGWREAGRIEVVRVGVEDLGQGLSGPEEIEEAVFRYVDGCKLFEGADLVVIENQILGYSKSNPIMVGIQFQMAALARAQGAEVVRFPASKTKFTQFKKLFTPEERKLPVKAKSKLLVQKLDKEYGWDPRLYDGILLGKWIHAHDAVGLGCSVARLLFSS